MNKTLCNLPVLLAFKSIERPDVVTNVEDISEVVSVYFPTELFFGGMHSNKHNHIIY